MNKAKMINHSNIPVLVGLDLSEMDGEIIRYTHTLRQWLLIGHLTFLHSVKLAELPPNLREPATLRRIAARIGEKIREQIAGILLPGTPFDIEVSLEEFPEMAFMQQVRKKQAGLVILGNKQTLEGSGGLSQKLARMLPAAVMLVPEGMVQIPSRIIEAIDFSKYTAPVVQWGRTLHVPPHVREMIPVNVNRMGYHAFPIFSDEEIEAVFDQEVVHRARKWKEQFPGEPPLQVIPSGGRSIASALLDFTRNRQAGMIILGVQGATSLTNLFMGSVANEILQRSDLPALLLVKP